MYMQHVAAFVDLTSCRVFFFCVVQALAADEGGRPAIPQGQKLGIKPKPEEKKGGCC